MVLPLRTGVENSAIRKCCYLYYDVDPAQEVHDVDVGWPVGVTWLVTIFGGGAGGAEPQLFFFRLLDGGVPAGAFV